MSWGAPPTEAKKKQDNRIESCLWAAVWIWHELLIFTLNCAVESRVIVASISQLVNSDNNVKKKGKRKTQKKEGKKPDEVERFFFPTESWFLFLC